MDADRIKWNQRYADEEYQMGLHPSHFLAERIELLKMLCPGRRALDIACGEGRNSIFLASHDFQVTAVDISDRGIEKGKRRMKTEGVCVNFSNADLEGYEIVGEYDLIVNLNFLLRELVPKEIAALSPGGVILFETILDSPNLPGAHTRRYLLQPGELHQLFSVEAGTILEYGEFPDNASPVSRIVFQKMIA